jgi:hypothetical protein
VRESAWGSDHVELVPALYDLATASWHQGNYRQAASMISRVLHVTEHAYGVTDQRLAMPLSMLARVLYVQQRVEETRRTMERFLAIIDRLPPHEQLALADIIQRSADLLGTIGQPAAAARLAGLLALARQCN